MQVLPMRHMAIVMQHIPYDVSGTRMDIQCIDSLRQVGICVETNVRLHPHTSSAHLTRLLPPNRFFGGSLPDFEKEFFEKCR